MKAFSPGIFTVLLLATAPSRVATVKAKLKFQRYVMSLLARR